MAKIIGDDNSGYRSFVPTYEYPVERRQVLQVVEDTLRTTGADPEFGRPLQFVFQNPNPLTMIRSARYRLPLKVVFKDQDNQNMSRKMALQMAMRNRPSKIFRQQRLLLNGMTFYHDSDQDRVEEFTNRYWDRGTQFQLENTGLPISRPVEFQYKTDTSRAPSERHIDLDTASEPIIQATMAVATTDNVNYTERVKQFADNWDQATSTWEGTAIIPLQCGPFQPYESRKTSKPGKFIPFVEQLQLECTFDQTSRGGLDRVATRAGQYCVAQNLFEKTGGVAEACSSYNTQPPDNVLTPYSVCINNHLCWLNVLLDTRPSGVRKGPLAPDEYRNIKTTAQHSKEVGRRYRLCKEAYKVGNAVRLGPEILAPTTDLRSAVARRAVIAGLVDFTSSVGQMPGGLLKVELEKMAWAGTDTLGGSESESLLDPRATQGNLRDRWNVPRHILPGFWYCN